MRANEREKAATTRGPWAQLKAVGALASVAGLFATFALPAFASQADPDNPTAFVEQAQSFSAPSGTMLEADASRDEFSVSKALPANSNAYSNIADTFSNNPNSEVNWPLLFGAPISSPYGWRTLRGSSNFHTGMDINPGLGTPIQSIAKGVVIDVGALSWDSGTYVVVEHTIDGQTVHSLYAHMLEDSPTVVVGQEVARGDQLGNVGCTGNCTGPHLHLELTVDGVVIDPYPWMKEHVGS